jgi:hypothetical protein
LFRLFFFSWRIIFFMPFLGTYLYVFIQPSCHVFTLPLRIPPTWCNARYPQGDYQRHFISALLIPFPCFLGYPRKIRDRVISYVATFLYPFEQPPPPLYARIHQLNSLSHRLYTTVPFYNFHKRSFFFSSWRSTLHHNVP